MSDIARLTVALYANSAQFTSELRRSQQMAGRWKTDVSKAFKAAAVAGAAAATALTVALAAVYREQSALIDQTAKFADRIGVSTEALSQLRYAAELSGVGARDLDMAMQRMTRRIAEAAQGSGEAAPALKQLGIDAQKLGQMTPDEQLHVLADAFKGVESQSERVRLAFKLFDSGGVAMINMLANGSESLKEMTDEADALGLTLTRVNAAKVEMANDAMTRVAATTTAFKQELTTQLAPVIAGIGELFTDNAKKHGGMSEFIMDGLDSIYKAVGFVADGFHGWKVILKGVEVIWKGFSSAFKIIAQGLVDITHVVGKAIFKTMVFPIKTALELAGNFSDKAKELAKTIGDFSNAKSIVLFDDNGINGIRIAKAELHDLAMQKLPSTSINEWVEENRTKFQKLAEEYAAGVNKNDPNTAGPSNTKLDAKHQAQAQAGAQYLSQLDLQYADEQTKLSLQHNSRLAKINAAVISETEAHTRGFESVAALRESFAQRENEFYFQKQQQDDAKRLEKLTAFLEEEMSAEQRELVAAERRQQMITDALGGRESTEEAFRNTSIKNWERYSKNIDKIEDARTQARLQTGAELFDALSGLAKAFSGEQSKAYKLMFIAQKAYTLASVLLSSKDAISKAWGSAAFPYNLPAVGMALAETGALKAAVSAISMPRFHTGGIIGERPNLAANEVPIIAERGEEMITKDDPRHRKNFGKASVSRPGSNVYNIHLHNNVGPATLTTEEDSEGNLHMYLEKADENAAAGIANQDSQLYFSLEAAGAIDPVKTAY